MPLLDWHWSPSWETKCWATDDSSRPVAWSEEFYNDFQNKVGGGKGKMRWYFGEHGWPTSSVLEAAPSTDDKKELLVDTLQDWKTEYYQGTVGWAHKHMCTGKIDVALNCIPVWSVACRQVNQTCKPLLRKRCFFCPHTLYWDHSWRIQIFIEFFWHCQRCFEACFHPKHYGIPVFDMAVFKHVVSLFRQSEAPHLVFRYLVPFSGTLCSSCLALDGMPIFENDV